MNGSVNRIQTTRTTEVLSIWVPNPFSNLCSCLIVLFIPPRQNESPFNLGYLAHVPIVTTLNSFRLNFLTELSVQLDQKLLKVHYSSL